MSLAKKQYKSRIRAAEKIFTTFDWVLEDWSLLHDCYYSNGVESPEFLLNGTEDVTWSLSLKPRSAWNNSTSNAVLKIQFSHEPTFLTMVFTISFINAANNEPVKTTQIFNSSAPKVVDVTLSSTLPKNCSHAETDELLLCVQFVIVKDVSISTCPDHTSYNNFRGDFAENLKAIFDSKKFYDVTFLIGDEKLFAHKVILAAKSNVFEAMFLSDMAEGTENVIEIIDTKIEVFEKFLNYIYVGKVSGLETIVDEMIVLADKYRIEDLKSICGNYMSAYLNTENVVRYLLVAYKLRCKTLKKKALELIKLNTHHILKNESDYNLLGKYPSLIQEIFSK